MTLDKLVIFNIICQFRAIAKVGLGNPSLSFRIVGFVAATFTRAGLMHPGDPGFELFFTDFRTLIHFAILIL